MVTKELMWDPTDESQDNILSYQYWESHMLYFKNG